MLNLKSELLKKEKEFKAFKSKRLNNSTNSNEAAHVTYQGRHTNTYFALQ